MPRKANVTLPKPIGKPVLMDCAECGVCHKLIGVRPETSLLADHAAHPSVRPRGVFALCEGSGQAPSGPVGRWARQTGDATPLPTKHTAPSGGDLPGGAECGEVQRICYRRMSRCQRDFSSLAPLARSSVPREPSWNVYYSEAPGRTRGPVTVWAGSLVGLARRVNRCG